MQYFYKVCHNTISIWFNTAACDWYEIKLYAHLTQSVTFITTHKKQLKYIWQFYYWITTVPWIYDFINNSGHFNGKQSTLFNKKAALFRKELCMDGNSDTDVPWEFHNGSDMNRCFHFGTTLLDHWSLNRYIDPDPCLVTPLLPSLKVGCDKVSPAKSAHVYKKAPSQERFVFDLCELMYRYKVS